MKKLSTLIVVSCLCCALNAHAQDYTNLKKIKLSNSENCEKAQPKVLECSDYLLSKPCSEGLNSLGATMFIIEWMGATPDFTFSLNDGFYKAIKSDDLLTARYYAALAKFAISEGIKEDTELQMKAITAFLEYCENPDNEVKMNKKLQKYADAKKDGNLKKLITGA